MGEEYPRYTSSVSLFFWVKDIPGTQIFSSDNVNSSSIPDEIFLTNNLSNALDVSERIIQSFKKVHPPIKTSSLGGTNISQFWFFKLSETSILKSSASLLVWL